MAKKSAMSLNPGADATLVAAATRAAMANVPKDLSGTFESMAKSYDAAMKSLGNSIQAVGSKVAPYAQNLIKEAIKNKNTETTADSIMIERPGETDKSLGDALRAIREEKNSLRGKFDRDSKIRKQELKAEKEKLYGEIEFLSKADSFNNELLASGNFSPEATGQMNTVMAGALQAYKTKSGKIQEGEYKGYHVTLGRNDNEDITFTLKDPNGKTVTGENTDGSIQTDGQRSFTIKSSDINNLLVPKYSQDKLNGVNKVYDALLRQSKTPYSSINVSNKIASFVDTENDLLGLMQKPLGANPTSFVEELNSASETSAAYFASLGSVTLKKLGVTDSDKSGTVGDVGDFANADNYAKVRSKLLDKSNTNYSFKDTQKAFLSYANEVGKKMHNFQPAVSTNNNNNNTGGSNSLAWGNTYKPYSEQDTKITDALAGKDLYDWENNKYTTKDGGATYSPVEANSLYSAGQNIPTNDLLSGGQFGLSHRIGSSTFSGSDNVTNNDNIEYNASDLQELGGSEKDDKALVKKFKDKYPEFEFDATTFDFGDKVKVTHKESGVSTKISVSPTFYTDLANFMNNPRKKLK